MSVEWQDLPPHLLAPPSAYTLTSEAAPLSALPHAPIFQSPVYNDAYTADASSREQKVEDPLLSRPTARTWDERRPAIILAIVSCTLALGLSCSTAASIKTPAWSWQFTSRSAQNATFYLGSEAILMPVEILSDQSVLPSSGHRFVSVPLWKAWEHFDIPAEATLAFWLASHILDLCALATLLISVAFVQHPESDGSLLRLRLSLMALLALLIIPSLIAWILIIKLASSQIPVWRLGIGGFLLDMCSLSCGTLCGLYALHLQRDPLATERRHERQLARIETRRRLDEFESKRILAKEVAKDPALALMLLSRRQHKRTVSNGSNV